jgi:hypothetical protein
MKGGGSKATMSWSDNVINTEEEVKKSNKKIKKNGKLIYNIRKIISD